MIVLDRFQHLLVIGQILITHIPLVYQLYGLMEEEIEIVENG
jgi:hypothetical protein